jgi:hypothetical protein
MQFEDRWSTVRCRGEPVLRSYRMIARSVAAVAMMDVSTWFHANALIVSIAVGQFNVCTGAPDALEMSYMETLSDAAAKLGRLRWCATDVNAPPCHVAFGALLEGVLYGSNS